MASLVYHSGALGDFITTLPAVEVWRREHPGEPLVLLGQPSHGALAPHLFRDTWDAGSARFARLFSAAGAAAAARELLPGITTALVFAQETSPLHRALSACGLAELARQDPFPAAEVHVVDYHLELFGDRVRPSDRTPRIPTPSTPATDLVAIHPGSGSARKNWPRDRFEELAAALSSRGNRLAWITGPADDPRPPRGPAQSWRSLPLPDLATRLSACRLFVGNDSGVSHLAAAVGCPTVALFGATSERVWSPRGPRVTVIRAATGRLEDISPSEVIARVLDLLGWSR